MKFIFALISLEGIIGILYFILLPSYSTEAAFSLPRLFIIAVLLMCAIAAGVISISLHCMNWLGSRINSLVEKINEHANKRSIVFGMGWLISIIILSFLIGLINLGSDPSMKPLLHRTAPLLVYFLLILVQLLIFFLPDTTSQKKLLPAIVVVVYFSAFWYQNIYKYSVNEFIQLSPFVALGIVLVGFLVFYLSNRFFLENHLPIFYIILFILLGVFFYKQAVDFAPLNDESERFDQNSYVRLSKKVYLSGYSYSGDRKNMIVYPLLQAVLNNPNLPAGEFFNRGKIINIQVSMVLLLFLGLFYRRFFSRLTAANLTMITAFSWFIYKSVYFKGELVYYFFFFLAFVLSASQFTSPSIISAVLAGLFWGLAYMTKASILPAVIIFTVVYTVDRAVLFLSSKRSNKPLNTGTFVHSILSGSLLVIFFLFSVSFYIIESKQKFGQYFYNANQFVVWSSSWPEAKHIIHKDGALSGWPDLPPDRIPNFQNYMRSHTFEQIVERFNQGALKQKEVIFEPYGQFNYITIFSIFLIISIAMNWSTIKHLLNKYWGVILFTTGLFSAYFVSYTWYIAILSVYDRFLFSLFIPYLFSAVIVIKTIWRNRLQKESLLLSSTRLSFCVNLFVFSLLLIEIFHGVPNHLIINDFG